MKATLAALSLSALLAPALSQAAEAPVSTQQYATVLAGSWRAPANSARDVYRHPQQTLTFFGLRPDQTLIEITPGGGWYSEVLAPLLKDHGHYIAAVQAPTSSAYARTSEESLKQNSPLIRPVTPRLASSSSTPRHRHWANRVQRTRC